ncbi:MAG: hypothetical protein A2511_17180 [Deltaproteobacteria bacterium RIFOXYD12_FULL_50_9]|nr:MAG: hypothetical protein A2511_17180 [Deltaproteobacteria bacterium RIFOXYD12_FULL_50_9]
MDGLFGQSGVLRVLPSLKAASKKDVLAELLEPVLAELGSIQASEVYQAIINRERLGATGIGQGAALPHALIAGFANHLAVCGRSGAGVSFDAADGKPIHFFLLYLAPIGAGTTYLHCLAMLAGFLRSAHVQARLLAVRDAKAIQAILDEFFLIR